MKPDLLEIYVLKCMVNQMKYKILQFERRHQLINKLNGGVVTVYQRLMGSIAI